MTLTEFMTTLDSFIWGTPFLATLIGAGIIFMIVSRGFVFRHFGHIWNHTLGTIRKGSGATGNAGGKITPFQAICVAVGGCVGTANISGVAAAFAYYDAALRFMLKRCSKKVIETCSLIFKILFPLPNIFIVVTMVFSGGDFTLYWAFVEVIIALPVFWNVIGMVILSPKFVELLKDYRARYLGIGKVDTNFKLFYETEPNAEAKALNEEWKKKQAKA